MSHAKSAPSYDRTAHSPAAALAPATPGRRAAAGLVANTPRRARTETSGTVLLIASVAMLLVACGGGDTPAGPAGGPGDASAPTPPPSKGEAPAAKGEAPAAKGEAPAAKGEAPASKGEAPAAKGNTAGAASAPPVQRPARLTVTATLTGVPAGAIVIAGGAKDRAFQKVSKSEHKGIAGAVGATDDGDGLLFVSDPIPADAASLRYEANYEVVRRDARVGDVAQVHALAFEAGEAGEVAKPKPDEALDAAAKALGADDAAPGALAAAAMTKAVGAAKAGSGPTAPAAVLAGGKAGALGASALMVDLLRRRGVPARVAQGFLIPELSGETAVVHAWVEVKLPKLGWTHWDPALAGGADEADEADLQLYQGDLPADRVTVAYGTTATMAALGATPAIALEGELVAPRAILDGKPVGTVTWKAVATPTKAGAGG